MDRLFVPSKRAYVTGKRPSVNCILCAITEKNPAVDLLDIFQSKNFIVSANLYPYNPGHIMIFPKRHILNIAELNDEEVLELHKLQVLSIRVIEQNYQAQGFNIGYNMGKASGASIDHLHLHIVPRYLREVGFIDVIGNARIIVEDPKETIKRLSESFSILSKNF